MRGKVRILAVGLMLVTSFLALTGTATSQVGEDITQFLAGGTPSGNGSNFHLRVLVQQPCQLNAGVAGDIDNAYLCLAHSLLSIS